MKSSFWNDYFSFTRKERTGIIVLLLLILFFSFLPFLFPFLVKQKKPDNREFEKAISTLKYKTADSAFSYPSYKKTGNYNKRYYPSSGRKYNDYTPKGVLFYFDPNTLSPEGWQKLGLRDKTISTIQHYVSKGGKFRRPADIGKIWGLHDDEVQRLMPFVRIQSETAPVYSGKKNYTSTPYVNPKYSNKPVDINIADTITFTELPGIGSRLASRIVKFRDKLGGFFRIEQVAETYALPDSTYQKIKGRLVLRDPSLKHININTATMEELKAHPYIRYGLANAIVQYRTQHGPFSAASEIRKIMTVTDEIYNKVLPYLSVE